MKNESFFDHLAKQKKPIKNEPVGVFNSVFSYGKLRDSSFNIFSGFRSAIYILSKTLVKCMKVLFPITG